MNMVFKLLTIFVAALLLTTSTLAGRHHERYRQKSLLGIGLGLLGAGSYGDGYGGYGHGYGHGYNRPIATTSYYGYPAYGSGHGYGGYNNGYGQGGYGYLDRPHGGYGSGYGSSGYGSGYGYNDGYGHGRVPLRVKTVIKSKHSW